MSYPVRRQDWSWDEFLAYADQKAERHEFIDGEPVLQAQGTRAHALVLTALAAILHESLKGKGYAVMVNAPFLRVGEDRFRPDVMVVEGERSDHDDVHEEHAPVLLAEVISGGTERRDRGRKWISYRSIPSLTVYLLVDPANRTVEIFTRSRDVWQVEFLDSRDRLRLGAPLSVDLTVANVFEDLGPL